MKSDPLYIYIYISTNFLRDVHHITLSTFHCAGSFKVVSSFYFQSSSFRKIEGNKCVNGTEKDFFPVRTPCPVQGKGCTTCMYCVYNG